MNTSVSPVGSNEGALPWYSRSAEDIFNELGVHPDTGLSADEVIARRVQYGTNEIPRGKKVQWWQLLFGQFKSPLIFILLIAAAMSAWLGETADAVVIMIAAIVNAAVGFWQEFRSNNTFEKLQAIIKVQSRVKRDGKIFDIDSKDLVPGDIIVIKAGMKVPADARLLSAQELLINEALLTGESFPVKKQVREISGTAGVGDRKNMLHMGTIAEKGGGTGVVCATGALSEIGQIAHLTVDTKEEATPLQERLEQLGKVISIIVIVSAIVIFVTGIWEAKTINTAVLVDMFETAVAVAVAAIPEGLPAALSVVLAIAAQRIFKTSGLVKKLIGAETLGSTSVICTDKTGTLTMGKMSVEKSLRVLDASRAELVIAFSNEAIIVEKDGKSEVVGEATDVAKLEYYLAKGGNLEDANKNYPRLAILPFDEEEKYIASYHSSSDGANFAFITGAPERLVGLTELSDTEKKSILDEVEEYAKKGFRMIGVAERKLEASQVVDPENYEQLRGYVNKLNFLGLYALRDPIREDVPESIKIAQRAGVRVIMVTGDHKLTALAIGTELGMGNGPDSAMEGSELDTLSDEELARRIGKIDIFARVNPKHKMRIVKALKDNGEVVAMTGDGVNDAPALKAADVGIAVGSGSDVTKEAADLVLLNDSFTVITEAIRQGRIAFDNMRKVVIFLFMGSFTEVIIILAALILREDILPITAVLILWANVIEDGFPTVALAFEPGDDGIMERGPYKRKELIMDRMGWSFVYIQGLVTDVILVGIYLYLLKETNYTAEHIQTFIFFALGADALFIIFSLKNLGKSIFDINYRNNKYLLFAVVIGFAIVLGVIYSPFMNNAIGTYPLTTFDVVFLLSLGVFKVFYAEIIKWWYRAHGYFKREPVLQMAK